MFSSVLKRNLTAILSSLVLVSTATAAHAEPAAVPQDSPVAGFIDSPTDGSVLSANQPFTVNGWLVDRTVTGTVGVDTVSVSAQQAGHVAIDLGHAQLALDRPDVAAATSNPNWANAGYSLTAPGLPAGTYTLNVNAHTSQGWVSRTTTLQVGELPATRWTAYGFNVDAPTSMWPMLEILHRNSFDWALAAASRKQTPIRWDDQMPRGSYGQYSPSQNTLKLSSVLQTTSMEARATFLAHELTHLNDDLNGLLGDVTGDNCYAAETRAFINEGNLWSMLFGRQGKQDADPIEAQENTKMWAFVGNTHFADLVVRTTASYVRQCGSD